jgi:hypothetical protein
MGNGSWWSVSRWIPRRRHNRRRTRTHVLFPDSQDLAIGHFDGYLIFCGLINPTRREEAPGFLHRIAITDEFPGLRPAKVARRNPSIEVSVRHLNLEDPLTGEHAGGE